MKKWWFSVKEHLKNPFKAQCIFSSLSKNINNLPKLQTLKQGRVLPEIIVFLVLNVSQNPDQIYRWVCDEIRSSLIQKCHQWMAKIEENRSLKQVQKSWNSNYCTAIANSKKVCHFDEKKKKNELRNFSGFLSE